MEPKARVPTSLPDSAHFTFLVEAPYISNLVRDLVSEDRSCLSAHVLVSSSEDDLVRFQLRTIGEAQTMREHRFNLSSLLHFDLSGSDELRGANIDVVSAAALEIFDEEACTIWSTVDFEACFGQTCKHILVMFGLQRADFDLQSFEDGSWKTMEQDVCFINLRAVLGEQALEANVGDGFG